MTETHAVADFLRTTDFSDLPSAVVDHATEMVLDTIGVTLLATGMDEVDLIQGIEGPRPRGDTTVIGGSDDWAPAEAAFVNGFKAHVLDFDDVHQAMGGHPSAPILPVVLGLGEQLQLTGKEAIRAFVLGVELETALGSVLNPGLYERGWHPTAILGHVGAAAAAGVVLDLTVDELQRAIGIAASQAGGIKGNFGTMTKPYHVARAARSGIEAARLADAGMTAAPDILERNFGGYCDLYKGEGTPTLADLGDLGDTWRLLASAAKKHPCCGSTHAAIDAVLVLRANHDIDPSRIERITVTEHPNRIPHTDNPTPTTGLEGKFSLQYVVARAILDGDLWLDDFTSARVTDPAVTDLMEAVEIQADPDAVPGHPFGAQVEITTRDGEQVFQTEANEGQLSRTALEEKYRRCATTVLSADAADRSVETIDSLARLDDVAGLLAPLKTTA